MVMIFHLWMVTVNHQKAKTPNPKSIVQSLVIISNIRHNLLMESHWITLTLKNKKQKGNKCIKKSIHNEGKWIICKQRSQGSQNKRFKLVMFQAKKAVFQTRTKFYMCPIELDACHKLDWFSQIHIYLCQLWNY